MPRGISRLRVVALLGGQRQLLDSQVQPQREGKLDQRRSQLAATPAGKYGEAQRCKSKCGTAPTQKTASTASAIERNDDGDAEGHLHAPDIQRHEDAVAQPATRRAPRRLEVPKIAPR